MSNTRGKQKPATGSRYGGGVRGVPLTSVSYGDIDPSLLHRTVCAVTNAGDAITFGKTSEGGAYYVGVLAEGQLEKFYLDSLEDAQDCLRSISEAGEALIQ